MAEQVTREETAKRLTAELQEIWENSLGWQGGSLALREGKGKHEEKGWEIRGALRQAKIWSTEGQVDNWEYTLKILIGRRYPQTCPTVHLVNQTDANAWFDHIEKENDYRICCAGPARTRHIWLQEPTLWSFIDKLVAPALERNRYAEKFRRRMGVELSHGEEGIREDRWDVIVDERRNGNPMLRYYAGIWSEKPTVVVTRILHRWGMNASGRRRCGCGRKRRVKSCHGRNPNGLLPEHEAAVEDADLLCRALDGRGPPKRRKSRKEAERTHPRGV